MKTKHFYHAGILAACSLGAVVTIGSPRAMAEEASGDYTGTIGLGAGGAFVDGDSAAFQRRLQQHSDFYGGITDFSYEREVGDTLWTLDGHALFGNDDYRAVLRGERWGTGYLEMGYQEFTTFYDGTGGFLPTAAPMFYPLAGDSLGLDRGAVWFEAGLRMEDKPEVTFRYTHDWRDGAKDSTMWGRPDSMAIAPTLYLVDETRDIFELDIAHVLGNTDVALGFRYESIDNLNDRVFEGGAEVLTEGYEADIFHGHASTVSGSTTR